MTNNRRIGRGLGLGSWLVAGGSLFGGVGCSGGDISAGQESTGFNLGRCYGAATNCGTSTQTTVTAESLVRPCGDPSTATLSDELLFETTPRTSNNEVVRVAPDGSVWLLRRAITGPITGPSMAGQEPAGFQVLLDHYAADGILLGTSPVLAAANQNDHLYVSEDLSVDGAGQALVAIYTDYAPNADSKLTETLTLHVFDSDLQRVGTPQLFNGVAQSKVVGSSGNTFAVAGNAPDNAGHGVLTRLRDGQPDWVQNVVPSSGLGAGVGVIGVALNDAGIASVLSQRNPRWEPGAADDFAYGVTRFDTNGNLVWDVKLPTSYTRGYPAALAGLSDGVVVAGRTDQFSSLLLRQVTSSGQLGWTYKITTTSGLPAVQVDATTGETYATTGNGIALVSADGQSCKQYSLPRVEGQLAGSATDVTAASPYLYVLADGIRRYKLPSE